MIRHVYLFKLRQGINPRVVQEKLLTLQARIPEIHSMEVGINFKPAHNAYDLVESCAFQTMEDFIAFGANEYHEQIRQYMETVQEAGVKIDYEV